jgi:hypothetical protein
MSETLNRRINISTDWSLVETNLLRKCRKLSNRRDIQRLIKNIQIEVTELSKAEVEARTGRKIKAKEILEKVNADIELVEGYLLVAALIG